ncbi:MAG: hypothetical protein Q8R10_01290 [Pseudomonas sp.]|nr:hypothetical protein [Pseudomonas sp.]MDP3845048.1 hypothetical protein [Pseudomonas sp.]
MRSVQAVPKVIDLLPSEQQVRVLQLLSALGDGAVRSVRHA